MHVICRVNQTEYVIRIVMAASPEYVNTYSTHRVGLLSRMVGLPSLGAGPPSVGVEPPSLGSGSVVSSSCHTYIPIYQAMDSSTTHHS